MRGLPLVVPLLALPLALAGCGEGAGGPGEPEWTEVRVPGGQMLDLEYELSSGTPIPWEWSVAEGRPMAFQALYVTGSSAYPLASAYAAADAGERTAPQSGRYDLTWDNQGTDELTVRFAVRPGYTQRLWPPNQGPGCGPIALASGLC